MKNEGYMKSLGFWKQKDGVYRPHPNCKCTWLSGFEEKYKKVRNLLSNLIKLKELKDFYNTKVPKYKSSETASYDRTQWVTDSSRLDVVF